MQKVNTDGITAAANRVRIANRNINTNFQTMERSCRELDCWKGQAGSKALTLMYQIFKNNDARSTVLENYANVLEQMVKQGYINAETTNKKLADQFK